ncbi:MAG: response regulator transcription factor [Acidimicrobiales bacterium]
MRILVVEDEADIAVALRRGLEAEGYAVDIAPDGDDALWLARERDYATIVLDLMLPGLNGFRICRTLRDEENWTPILVLTAKNGEFDEAEALDCGADDFLRKPFSHVVLAARLRALVRRGSRERPPVLCVDGLEIDPASRECRRDGQTIELTSRELAVLETLMRAPGTVLSKSDILESVWDEHFAGDPNIVEVYIARLRRKVDQPFGRTTIQTVRGSGYRISPTRSPSTAAVGP